MSVAQQIKRYPASFENIVVGCGTLVTHPLHWHDFYEFEFVISGNEEQNINGTPTSYKKGDVFLLGPTDFHEYKIANKTKIWLVQIPISKIPQCFYSNHIELQLPLKVHLESSDFNTLSTLLEMLKKCIDSKNKQNMLLTDSILNTILLFISGIERQPVKTNPNNRIVTIYNYLQEHFAEDISSADIAKKVAFNHKYLCSYFKKHTGRTLTDTIREMRLIHASHLVLSTEKSIQEIFPQCGYNSASFFLRDFKKRFGVTPTQMRKKTGKK